jgi:hypothetical protein
MLYAKKSACSVYNIIENVLQFPEVFQTPLHCAGNLGGQFIYHVATKFDSCWRDAVTHAARRTSLLIPQFSTIVVS